ncbi:nuclear transport factor 2 family protein [Alteromonas antoniana]|uniref:nuclear transport factor 2 family protein n=1 Tax=Alteromonas antoniana TaxID=2803813 RepID=UPI001FE9D9EA|nr:nuclear transport factor 2 family protein [Alteromonas antoniana]
MRNTFYGKCQQLCYYDEDIMRLLFYSAILLMLTLPVRASDTTAIETVLDSLHQHSAEAKGKAYFSLYADNAMFIGTDASETWTLDEFKQYAMLYFDQGKGWRYHSVERHISLSDSGDIAWFVEMLESESFGVTRGTGVLQKYGDKWLIEQYHLTLPIPNSMIDNVADDIKHQSL